VNVGEVPSVFHLPRGRHYDPHIVATTSATARLLGQFHTLRFVSIMVFAMNTILVYKCFFASH
jgi:hypothetical protein